VVTRRRFVLAAGAVAAAPLVLQGCTSGSGDVSYDEAVQRTWRSAERAVSDSSLLHRELVRYATLAPSSHNTQCWKFALQEHAISIVPDLSRRCPAVDPDDHHLFVSLGCAAENLIQAALANGVMGEAAFEVVPTDALNISLAPTKLVVSRLFEAIPHRQCTRAAFDGQPLSNEELRLLEQAGTGKGIEMLLLTDKTAMDKAVPDVKSVLIGAIELAGSDG
jgi:hypothetical protein